MKFRVVLQLDRMKLFFTILLISSFSAMAVFGAFAMNHGSDHGMSGGCVAATAKGVDCPETASPLNFLSFHLDAFQGFSRAIFSQDAVSSLALLVALTLLAVFSVVIDTAIKIPQLSFPHQSRRFLESSHPLQKELVHWLALHENSPAFS